MSDWIAMKTKFVGKCKICSKVFAEGDDVRWKKGEGVKCPADCVAESVYENKSIISDTEWKDFTKYSRTELSKISNCQCCGKSIDITKDTYTNDDKRTCEKCWSK